MAWFVLRISMNISFCRTYLYTYLDMQNSVRERRKMARNSTNDWYQKSQSMAFICKRHVQFANIFSLEKFALIKKSIYFSFGSWKLCHLKWKLLLPRAQIAKKKQYSMVFGSLWNIIMFMDANVLASNKLAPNTRSRKKWREKRKKK